MKSRIKRSIGLLLIFALVVSVWGAVGAQEDKARPFLGIGMSAVEDGVKIDSVMPGSPADEAGLQVGDIVTAIGGQAVTAENIREMLAEAAVGDTITLDVARGDETLQLDVTLAARPDRNEDFNREFPMLERLWLGVGLEVSADGVVIQTVEPESPAAAAGLQEGDLLRKIGDREITNVRAAVEAVRQLEAGSAVTLEVEREGETLTLEATLESRPMPEMPFGFEGRRPDFGAPFDRRQIFGGGWLGIQFVTLDADVAQERGLDQNEGALITEVQPESPAAAADLQVDDIITAVNSEPVNEEWTLRDRLAAYEPEDTITLDVLRGGETLQVEATLAQPEPGMMPFFGDGGFQFFGPEGMGIPFGFEVFPPEVAPAQPEAPNI